MAAVGAKIKNIVLSDGHRSTWTSWLEYFAAALNFTTALGTLWRFPYFLFRNGGRVFYLPFILFVIFLAFPLIFIETSLGQFTSLGPIKCWRLSPIAQGIGAAMVVNSGIIAIYYSSIVSLSFYYFFASMTSKLPWAECGHDWNTESCETPTFDTRTDCLRRGLTAQDNGRCYDEDYVLKAYWGTNHSQITRPFRHVTVSSNEYFSRQVLRYDYSTGLDDLGEIVWHMALLNLFVWVVVAFILSKSLWLYGKVAVATKGLHIVLLAVFIIYGRTLYGHSEGFKFFDIPRGDKLVEHKVWYDAGFHVLFTFSLFYGGISTLSSYNKFDNDNIRDSLLLSFFGVAVSAVSGVAMSYLFGALAMKTNSSIEGVVSTGMSMAFVAIPSLFAMETSGSSILALLWFLMLICIALGHMLGLVETVIAGILDAFPRLRRLRLAVVGVVCAIFFLLGLPLTTEGGLHYLTWLDFMMASWQMYTISSIGLIAVLIYGLPRLLNDVEVMVGSRSLFCIPIGIMKIFTGLPIITSILGIFFLAIVHRIDHLDFMDSMDWPKWATVFGDLIIWTTPVLIICGGIYSIIQARGLIRKDLLVFLFPMKDWGPVGFEHRTRVARYVPMFNVGSPDEASVEMNVVQYNVNA